MTRDEIEAVLARASTQELWELVEAAQVELRARGWIDAADRLARARDALEDRLGSRIEGRRR